MAVKFAGFPTSQIFNAPNGKAKKQLLWGDTVDLTGPSAGGWQPVKCRGVSGFMRDSDLEPDRLLEIVFVDIGQGDGALIITPDNKHMLVDAGEADNLYRFLRWRYDRFAKPVTFEAAVISHSDQDHYQGFAPIFAELKASFANLYHNGIVERAGDDLLGPRASGHLTDVVTTRAELEAIVNDPAKRGSKQYPRLLFALLASGRCADARGLSAADKHLPGFAPGQSPMTIEILGPVRGAGPNGAPRMKWFGDAGKTKNGHSVVLRLVYRDISVLMGGDLNIPAENHLLADATGYPMPPAEADRAAALEGARRRFRSDVAKSCHHGSADFTDLYLQAVDPLVTVISSGDNEGFSHPRADALGAVGKWGRGSRPLIFSTELARSAPEAIKQPYAFRKELDLAYEKLKSATGDSAIKTARAKVDKLLQKIERSVAVYGAINLRSDGSRIVMAQKIEAPKSPTQAWDVYALEPDAAGVLRYRSKHD